MQSDSPLSLKDPVTALRGVGAEKALLLQKLGIKTISDLLLHSPRRHEDRRHYSAIGEGEPLWPQILRDAEAKDLKPRYVQQPHGTFDLRDAPMPRYDLLDPAKYNRITVQTSRGCPHKCKPCAFCSMNTAFHFV